MVLKSAGELGRVEGRKDENEDGGMNEDGVE